MLAFFELKYNTTVVLAGTGLLGMAAGIIGSFAVLRRRALLGDALSHAALPGICLAFLIVEARSMPALITGAFVTAVLGMLAVTAIVRHTRTKEDAAIGIVLSVFFGAGIVLMRIIQNASVEGSRAGLNSFIFGKTAGIVAIEVYAVGVLVVVVIGAVLLLYKEFKLVSFDPDFASVQGWPSAILDALLLGLLTVTTVVGLPAVGVVLMVAMLILPGAAARFWTERLNILLVLSALFGFLAGSVGTVVSATTIDLPAGPTIVLVGSAIFGVSLAIAPRRGILARGFRRLRLASKVERQHLLRAAYEVVEPGLPGRAGFQIGAVSERRRWPLAVVRRALRKAEHAGLVAQGVAEGEWRLTDRGRHQAAEVTRLHRLWELYLINYAHVAADHVDRDADMIEHVLPPELVHELERELEGSGRLPSRGEVPSSPHEFGGLGRRER